MEKMVKPVITYGAEIWGFNMHKCVEDVQVKYGRFMLGLPSSAPRASILGDCGFTPIHVDCILKAVKYWLRLIKLEPTSLCKSAYLMLYELDLAGRKTWAGEVRRLLLRLGFDEAWEAQQIGNENVFLSELKSKLLTIAYENWEENVISNNRLVSYRQYKTVYNYELYVSTLSNINLRRALARLRNSSHCLFIETGRHNGTPRHERICPSCKNMDSVEVIEDEYHFVCRCYLYKDLRLKFLPAYINEYPCHEMFNNLMLSKNTSEIRNFAIFVNEAFKIRANYT